MKRLILGGSTALALFIVPFPALAQNSMSSDEMMDEEMTETTGMEMSEDQMAMYEVWPEERRNMYDEWPVDVQTYYWTLNDQQQEGWWALRAEDRTRLYSLSPEQRTVQWASIVQQLNNRTTSASASPGTSAPTSSMSTTSTSTSATASPSPEAKSDYPICQGDVQDSCIQPRAAGKNWGNRPLDYWPGQPASQMRRDKK